MSITITDFKAAFREAVSEEFKDIPTDESNIAFTFSERFNKQMEKLIKSQSKIYYSFINTAYKRVATVFVVFLTVLTAIFSIKPLREPAFNFFGGIYNSLNQSYFKDNSSNTSSSKPNGVTSNTSSVPSEKKVKYRLIYAKEDHNYDEQLSTPSRHSDLVNGYLKKVVSQFEGQDVYFRVRARPEAVSEDRANGEITPEKYIEIINSRLEYIKEVGAMDIVQIENFRTYYITVNAEMINKIGEAGGCYLYLATVPRPDDYDKKIPDYIAYSLENMNKGDTVAARIQMACPEGEKTITEFFSKNKIKDEQLSKKDFRADHASFTGSFTKEQILALAANENVRRISNVIEDNIEIINVTESMSTH